jgi:hypothetical protein
MDLSFIIVAGPCQRSHSQVRVPGGGGLMTIFYCLRFEISSTGRAMSPYSYRPGRGWPSYTPRHWIPLSSPPTYRFVTMEVFELASTREVGRTGRHFLCEEAARSRPELRHRLKN